MRTVPYEHPKVHSWTCHEELTAVVIKLASLTNQWCMAIELTSKLSASSIVALYIISAVTSWLSLLNNPIIAIIYVQSHGRANNPAQCKELHCNVYSQLSFANDSVRAITQCLISTTPLHFPFSFIKNAIGASEMISAIADATVEPTHCQSGTWE